MQSDLVAGEEHLDARPNPAKRGRNRSATRSAQCLIQDEEDALALARCIEIHGLARLSRWSKRRMRSEAGLTSQSARRLAAGFALGRAVERSRQGEHPPMTRPSAVAEFLAPRVRGTEQEQFYTLLLDGRHRLRRLVRVGVGTLTCALVHPREVFSAAVREASAALIVAHNHPSGDPAPSAEDREITRRLIEAGALLGIPLLDHVIVGEGSWRSLRESMPEAGWRA